MPPWSQRRPISTNFATRPGGQAEPIYRKETAALFPVEPEAIGTLQQGEFYIRLGDKPPFKMRVQDNLLGDRNTMNPAEWGRVRQVQLDRYYRPIDTTPSSATSATRSQDDAVPSAPRSPEEDMKPARWGD